MEEKQTFSEAASTADKPPRKSSASANSSRKISSARSKGQARISVSELRAQYKKKLSLSKSEDHPDQDAVVFDPMGKCREFLGKIHKKTGVIFDRKMEEFFCLWDESNLETPSRYSAVINRCEELDLFSHCDILPPRQATKDELLTQHSEEIIDIIKGSALETDTEKLEELSSYYDSVSFHPNISECAEIAAGCSIDLISAIVKGEIQNGMAIVRPPGHHAMQSKPCGFSFYNNVALATKHALDNLGVKRVLIVDWDVHHGQGTQQMFYEDDRVLYFSVHRYEHGAFWPNLRESDYDHIGAGKGLGYTCNVPLNATGAGNKEYLAIWTQLLLPLAYQFCPDLVIVSAGYDAATGCPEGEMNLTPAMYSHLTSLLMPLAEGKIALVLEGGYCLESLSEGAALSLKTLMGHGCPDFVEELGGHVQQSVSDSILNCISVLRGKWSCFNYQASHGADAPLDRASRSSKPKKHQPLSTFQGLTETPSRFPTRNYSPVQSEETKAVLVEKLNNLQKLTKLSRKQVEVVYTYDEVMERHECETGSNPECPARTITIIKLLKAKGYLNRMKKVESREVKEGELVGVHSKELVSMMLSLKGKSAEELREMEENLTSIYFNDSTLQAALISTGSLLQVVSHVVSSEASSHGVAIVRPPGHHAEPNEPNGFCFFNNVSVAAKYAVDSLHLQRVLILDWDIHHGNGTQHIFEEDPRVLYISLHLYKNATFFPHSTDANYDNVGKGKGEGYNVNIPWQKSGVGDAEYIAAFTQLILPIAYSFSPQLVLVSAGFDAAVNDPLGGCEVTPQCFGHLTSLLKGLAGGKLVLALEGGYNLVSTSHSLAMCVSALLGDSLPPLLHPLIPAPHSVSTINTVLDHLAPYWPCLSPFRVSLPSVGEQKKQRRSGVTSLEKKGDDEDNQIPSLGDSLSQQMASVTLTD